MKISTGMECWRKHRVAGLAGDEALETLLVIMEVGGHQSPLGSGLSSLPPRSDDGAMEALGVRDESREMDIMSSLPTSPQRSGANEQQALQTGTLSSAQGDFIPEEVDSPTMPPLPGVNVTDEMDPVIVLENGTEDRRGLAEETGLRRRKGFKITAGGPGIVKMNDSVWELYSPEGVPEVDIIFFHGLQLGDLEDASWSTWLARGDNELIWPKEWLPLQLPNARIISVSYSSLDQNSFAEKLVADLISAYRTASGTRRPVVLVGHSNGGVVVKLIIAWLVSVMQRSEHSIRSERFNEFLENIAGAFFYATPGKGSAKIEDFANRLANISPIPGILKVTKVGRISYDFEATRRLSFAHLRTSGVGENLPVNLLGFRGLIVPEADAKMGVDEFYISPNADHCTVCQATSIKDYIIRKLTRFIADCCMDTKITRHH